MKVIDTATIRMEALRRFHHVGRSVVYKTLREGLNDAHLSPFGDFRQLGIVGGCKRGNAASFCLAGVRPYAD